MPEGCGWAEFWLYRLPDHALGDLELARCVPKLLRILEMAGVGLFEALGSDGAGYAG